MMASEAPVTPAFKGIEEDGNPIVFLMMHYRARIEGGKYYQRDLKRDDPKLLRCLQNVFKNRYWQRHVDEAVKELAGQGITKIMGYELVKVERLFDLVPPAMAGRRSVALGMAVP